MPTETMRPPNRLPRIGRNSARSIRRPMAIVSSVASTMEAKKGRPTSA